MATAQSRDALGWPCPPISPKLIHRDSMEALRLARDDGTVTEYSVQVKGAVVPKDSAGETIATMSVGYQKDRDTCRPPSFAIIHWTGQREATSQVRHPLWDLKGEHLGRHQSQLESCRPSVTCIRACHLYVSSGTPHTYMYVPPSYLLNVIRVVHCSASYGDTPWSFALRP
jgi:hypothetical protein